MFFVMIRIYYFSRFDFFFFEIINKQKKSNYLFCPKGGQTFALHCVCLRIVLVLPTALTANSVSFTKCLLVNVDLNPVY